MSQDVTQWLDEIKTLRAQLVTLQQERDEAFKESVTWRDRLDAEMKLRVRETELLRQQIETLEVAQRKSDEARQSFDSQTTSDRATSDDDDSRDRETELEAILMSLTTVDELRQYAGEIAKERDCLHQDLQEERLAHRETRENLSIALGDAIDLLSHRSPESSPS